MAWSDHTWVTGETITSTLLNGLRDNFRFLHDRGGDLTSGTTVTPTTGFHKVTGTSTVDNIASPTDGHSVVLWFGSALTVRNNGGGTGNIRTATGADRSVAADTMLVFRSDGTVWKEVSPPSSVGTLLDSTLGSDTASFDVQNIPAGAVLEALLYARCTDASTTSGVTVRFNNDSGSNYDRQRVRGAGSTASANESLATAVPSFAVPGNNATANKFGAARILVPHYAGSANHKTADISNAHVEGTGTGTLFAEKTTIVWRSTSAITRLTLLPPSSNLKTDSRLRLDYR